MKITALIAAILTIMSSSVWGQGTPKTLNDLARYKGADRDKVLLDVAKAEGKVVWYTSLAGGSYKALVAAFEKKYTSIKVEVYRAGSKDIAPKIINEAQAGRYLADAVESTPGILMLLRDQHILQPYTTPELKRYPEEARTQAQGDEVFWVTDRESFIGLGYNKKMLPQKDVPKNYQDLLKPALKGKLAMSIDSTGDRVIGTMLKVKGPEYVEKLRGQEVKLFKISGAAMRDLIVAGEVTASPAIFRNHVLVKIAAGAPIDWVPMDLVPTNAGGSGVIAKSSHPHAALLLIDFIIGEEGQSILESFKYGVAWKNYPFKRYYPERGMTTPQYQQALKKWDKLLLSLGKS